jgi:hypothetical protein
VLNIYQSAAIVAAIVAGSTGFLGLLQRIWPNEQRRLHNELIGWQVSVLGTTYAVIVGFMLYAVWSNFQLADDNAGAEANCLLNVVRTAQGLPGGERLQIQDLARKYVNVMLSQEWPAMSQLHFSPESQRIIMQLWTVVSATKVHDAAEQTSLDHTLTEISQMTEHRRARQLQVMSSLPEILWGVLIVGAIVTIISSCMFGTVDFKLHFLQVFMLSLLVGLALVSIGDINHPFQGSVHVEPTGFVRAHAALADMTSATSVPKP